jgi:YesN/AraC family two-component response regulator
VSGDDQFMKLLIVDDNPSIRKIVRHLLSDRFEQIHDASNGLEALEVYQKFIPDFVVMDIEMPEVDGLVGAKMIKNEFPQSRIIMMSKFKDEEMISLSKYIGAEAYFFKDDLSQIESYFETQAS